MAHEPNHNDTAEFAAIERLLDDDASQARADMPAGLDDRIFVASQRSLAAHPPVVVRRLRWAAPLAAAAILAIATTLLWPTSPNGSAPAGEAEMALLETDIEAVVATADIEEELAELDALLASLDELESTFAMNWTDNVSFLESEFEIEEIVQ